MSDTTAHDDRHSLLRALIARDLRICEVQTEVQNLLSLQAAAKEDAEARFKETAHLTRRLAAAKKAGETDKALAKLRAECDALKTSLAAEKAAKARCEAEVEALKQRIAALQADRP
ncbi:hypothetical protein [Falsirhodobacter algicola]|uniref:Uncharacterized protein n=1 Tax=Falsirhodobacter algicola TaxID=2692330 RepID=A0A8J8SLB3_9RHOB|nr:hypothetical protein [Falsirhodobacter algicola]QUS36328.1 hypothetical protein GR316_08635 [Falsirhodobacter algicola]